MARRPVEWEQRVAQFLSATLQGAGVVDGTGAV
jgi:hypothetical protein